MTHLTPTIDITDQQVAERAAKLRELAPARREYNMPHPDLKGTDRVWEPCGRCGGTGLLQHYYYVEAGRCFTCAGAGGREILVSSVRSRLRREVRQHNERVDSLTVDAEGTARLELQAEAAEAALRAEHEAREEVRRKEAQLAAEKAELAADELGERYAEGTKLVDLPVTVCDSYKFWKDAYNPWEAPVDTAAIVFEAADGAQFVWYSSGAKAHALAQQADKDVAPLQLTIRGTVKRVQERNDGTARVVLTRATYKIAK